MKLELLKSKIAIKEIKTTEKSLNRPTKGSTTTKKKS
jgi:hypothetical protein